MIENIKKNINLKNIYIFLKYKNKQVFITYFRDGNHMFDAKTFLKKDVWTYIKSWDQTHGRQP